MGSLDQGFTYRGPKPVPTGFTENCENRLKIVVNRSRISVHWMKITDEAAAVMSKLGQAASDPREGRLRQAGGAVVPPDGRR
jgi:hypothetical protein